MFHFLASARLCRFLYLLWLVMSLMMVGHNEGNAGDGNGGSGCDADGDKTCEPSIFRKLRGSTTMVRLSCRVH